MTSPSALHNEAMDLVDRALHERSRGDLVRSVGFFRQALRSELDAVELLPEQRGLGWSILLRSAATMALHCEDFRLAEQLASRALAGDPDPDIADELRVVWEQANFHRHLEFRGYALSGLEIQLSLVGEAVSSGMANLNELLTRAESFQKLIFRIAQRRMLGEYRSHIPSVVKRRFMAFAAVPTAGSFAIAIKLAHTREQTSFPGLLGIEDVVDEFLNLLEAGEERTSDALGRLIPDPDFRKNFVSLGKKLAPDGKRISQVGFTLVNRGDTRSMSVTTPKSRFLSSQLESHDPTERIEQVSGILRFADASTRRSNQIRLVSDKGDTQVVLVPPGLMDDIVRPMWNLHVTARGTLKGRQKYPRLLEIWESDPEADDQLSNPGVVSDSSFGEQEKFI